MIKKFFVLMLAVAAISVSLVSCSKEKGNENGNNNSGNELSYIETLLALPEGLSEDADHIYVKLTMNGEYPGYGNETVEVMTFTFDNNHCTKAISDLIFETEEYASAYYEYMLADEDYGAEELDLITKNGRILTADMTILFAGATREDIKTIFEY